MINTIEDLTVLNDDEKQELIRYYFRDVDTNLIALNGLLNAVKDKYLSTIHQLERQFELKYITIPFEKYQPEIEFDKYLKEHNNNEFELAFILSCLTWANVGLPLYLHDGTIKTYCIFNYLDYKFSELKLVKDDREYWWYIETLKDLLDEFPKLNSDLHLFENEKQYWDNEDGYKVDSNNEIFEEVYHIQNGIHVLVKAKGDITDIYLGKADDRISGSESIKEDYAFSNYAEDLNLFPWDLLPLKDEYKNKPFEEWDIKPVFYAVSGGNSEKEEYRRKMRAFQKMGEDSYESIYMAEHMEAYYKQRWEDHLEYIEKLKKDGQDFITEDLEKLTTEQKKNEYMEELKTSTSIGAMDYSAVNTTHDITDIGRHLCVASDEEYDRIAKETYKYICKADDVDKDDGGYTDANSWREKGYEDLDYGEWNRKYVFPKILKDYRPTVSSVSQG